MPRRDATRRVAKLARAGGGVDVCGNPGRGINLFKDFHPIFRALVACRSGGPDLSARMPRRDATRRVAKLARAGGGVDVCGNPGRGINLFKDFHPIFRALVACRSGGPDLSARMPRRDATRRVAKLARAGSGVDVCGNPGRGINLFKDFRPIFRALVACRSGGPNLSALMPRSDATRRVAKRARAGSGADVCGNPGRGINLFKDFRPIFRALVACRSGGPNHSALMPRGTASCQVSKRARAGGGVRTCGGLLRPARGEVGSELVPLACLEFCDARLRWPRRGRRRRSGFETGGHGAALLCCRDRQNKSRTYFLPHGKTLLDFSGGPWARRRPFAPGAGGGGARPECDQRSKTREGPSTAFGPRARGQGAAVRARRRRLRRCECAWRARSTSRRSYRRRSRRCARFAR